MFLKKIFWIIEVSSPSAFKTYSRAISRFHGCKIRMKIQIVWFRRPLLNKSTQMLPLLLRVAMRIWKSVLYFATDWTYFVWKPKTQNTMKFKSFECQHDTQTVSDTKRCSASKDLTHILESEKLQNPKQFGLGMAPTCIWQLSCPSTF